MAEYDRLLLGVALAEAIEMVGPDGEVYLSPEPSGWHVATLDTVVDGDPVRLGGARRRSALEALTAALAEARGEADPPNDDPHPGRVRRGTSELDLGPYRREHRPRRTGMTIPGSSPSPSWEVCERDSEPWPCPTDRLVSRIGEQDHLLRECHVALSDAVAAIDVLQADLPPTSTRLSVAPFRELIAELPSHGQVVVR